MKHKISHPSQPSAKIRLLKKSFVRWLTQEEFDLFATLNLNTESTPQRLRSAFKALLARLDRHFLGRDWCNFPSRLRTKAVAVVENLDTNPHMHVLMTLPRLGRKLSIRRQRRIIDHYWTSLFPSGSTNVQAIYDAKHLVPYLAKRLKRPGYFEKFMLSQEFHNK
jgi:hypothetical protein